jgi:hypothetical protein
MEDVPSCPREQGAARASASPARPAGAIFPHPTPSARPRSSMSSHHSRARARALRLLVLTAFPAITRAQTPAARGDDPPAPVAPAVIARDTAGRATVRAIKLPAPLTLDGVLDEAVYTRELPFDGLIQVVPAYGAPASERSDIWVMYDTEHMYVSSGSPTSTAATPTSCARTTLRRALRHLPRPAQRLHVLHERRSARVPTTRSSTKASPTPTGIRCGRAHRPLRRRLDDGDGDPVQVAALPSPAATRPGASRCAASIRRKNEWAHLTPLPRRWAAPQALNRVSAGGTLVGLDLPPAGRTSSSSRTPSARRHRPRAHAGARQRPRRAARR